MKISVAMATYNGEKYLLEQLDSLVRQTCLPDELVVCDDGSTDTTLDILDSFSSQTSGIEVRVFRNDSRRGYAENFMEAVKRCAGDIIFLCDQDDVWLDTKIEVVRGVFESNPGAWLVVNDAELVDAGLLRSGLSVEQQVVSTGLPSEALLLGCCMSMRSEVVPLLSPVPTMLAGHDGWLNLVANTLGFRVFVGQVLQLYRRHGTNASSNITTEIVPSSRRADFVEKVRALKAVSPEGASEKRLALLKELESRLRRDSQYLEAKLPDPLVVDRAIAETQRKIGLNSARLKFQRNGVVKRAVAATVFGLRGGYRDFNGWKSLARDVIG